jgi:hypothetical protein
VFKVLSSEALSSAFIRDAYKSLESCIINEGAQIGTAIAIGFCRQLLYIDIW